MIPSAFYSLDNFSEVVEFISGSVRHCIPESSLNGKFPRFGLYISPFNRSIVFIQRLENLKVTKLKTTTCSNVVEIRIENCGNPPPNTNCNIDDTGYPFRPTKEDVPIILTGLNLFAITYGNIPITFLESQPFFPEGSSMATNFNTYTCPDVSYDIITNEFIYELNVIGSDQTCSPECPVPFPAEASTTFCIKFDVSTLEKLGNGHPTKVEVGRALKFEIDTCEGTFGDYLGLTTADMNVYVNTNIDLISGVVQNKLPWKITGTGQLSLATDDYVLMRIGTSSQPVGTISNNLTCAKGSNINAEVNSLDKDNFFFAKIIFSDKLPGDVSIIGVAGTKFFFDAPLVKLTDLTVEFFDLTGKQMKLNLPHSFTLEIIELREVLKDTLIDSRTGNEANVGYEGSIPNVI